MKAIFENGASRSEKKPPYHMIPVEVLTVLAERFGLGAVAHVDLDGIPNWRRGGPQFIAETRNHLAEHCWMLITGDKSDDHLGAVLANAAMLAWWERTGEAAWNRANPEP